MQSVELLLVCLRYIILWLLVDGHVLLLSAVLACDIDSTQRYTHEFNYGYAVA